MAKDRNHKHYGYKVLKEIWDAYKRGTHPAEIARQCGRTVAAVNTTIWKLKKMSRLEGQTLAAFVSKYSVSNSALRVILDDKQNQAKGTTVKITLPKTATQTLEDLIEKVEKARELYDEAVIKYAMEVAKGKFKKKEGKYEAQILGLQNKLTALEGQSKQSRLSRLLRKKSF